MSWTKALPGLILIGVVAGACTEETIVYRDRAPFNPPADAASGFLGYYTVADKQTTCGNCHVGVQTQWETTAHADAWDGLQQSGHAQAFCEECHTVNELGNAINQAAGYNTVPDSTYHDVQCESCHGPGLTHVEEPGSSQPLASIAVPTDGVNGCGECHTGAHHPYVEQWAQSLHGSGHAVDHAGANATCAPCHEGRAAIEVKFGDNTRYIEQSDTVLQHITCAVCHDPHGSQYEGQLRASISEPSIDNLCVTCHGRKGTPPWGTASATSPARGSHAAQGFLVLGQNVGWIPPNFAYDTTLIVSSHGTEANPRLCATCHVSRATFTDALSGQTFESTGHLFAAIPCTDSAGLPTANQNCTLSQRDFSACATSGCHLTPTAARSAYIATESSLNNLLDQLWADTDGNGIVDATDGGLLADMVARNSAADQAALNFGSNVMTSAKGSIFNASLAATNGREYFLSGTVYGLSWSAHPAAGNGVHNPFLLEALLTASIAQMTSEYALAPPPQFDGAIRATPPPGLRHRSIGTR